MPWEINANTETESKAGIAHLNRIGTIYVAGRLQSLSMQQLRQHYRSQYITFQTQLNVSQSRPWAHDAPLHGLSKYLAIQRITMHANTQL